MPEKELDINQEIDIGNLSSPLQKHTEIDRKESSSESCLDRAILKTIAYVDIYDYPLTASEIHRYLIERKASLEDVQRALGKKNIAGQRLEINQGYYTLPQRISIVDMRLQRSQIARLLWPKAIYYGQLIGALPLIRMVAVTGSLAVDNADMNSDIDFLIVTKNDRLWTARAMVVLLVRFAAKRSTALCPNYLVSERSLVFQERNLYTAHEVAQMVPVAGIDVYRRMREANGWVSRFLPNASGSPQPVHKNISGNAGRLLMMSKPAALVLQSAPGSWIERWEMARKVRKFTRLKMGDETAFSADWCKGHFDNHGRRALETFETRWQGIVDRTIDGKAS